MKTGKHILALCICLFTFSFIYANNADSAKAYLEKGLQAKQERKWQVAINTLQKAIEFDATNQDVLKELGDLAFDMRNYNLAIDAYTKLIAVKPDHQWAIEQMANVKFFLRNYKDALKYAEQYEKLVPSKPMHYLVGMCLYGLENYPYAVNRLLLAADSDPNNAQLFYTIGRSYVEMERYKQAVPHYQKAISLDNSKFMWIYELAMVYYSIPDDKNAIAMMELAAEKGLKKDADYYENLGYAYMNLGNFKTGAEMMHKSLEIKPYNKDLMFVLGEAYYKGNQYDKAIETYDLIMQSDNNNGKALYMIGMTYQKKGDKEKGMALCDKAIELDPSLASLKQKKGGMGL